jgi:hypothetical protein
MDAAKAMNLGSSCLLVISMITKNAINSVAMSAKVRIHGGGQ